MLASIRRRSRAAVLLFWLLISFPIAVFGLALVDAAHVGMVRQDVSHSLDAAAAYGTVALVSGASASEATIAAEQVLRARCTADPKFAKLTSGCTFDFEVRTPGVLVVRSSGHVATYGIGILTRLVGQGSIVDTLQFSSGDSATVCQAANLPQGCFAAR